MESAASVADNGRGVGQDTFVGVAYFDREMAKIDSCEFSIMWNLADNFKINAEDAKYLVHLPKILAEVSGHTFSGSSKVRFFRNIAVWKY